MRNIVRFVATAACACHGLLAFAETSAKTPAPASEPIVLLDKFVVGGGEDPNSLMPNQPIDTLGLSKKIVETPRSVSVVSGEMIEKFNMSELADIGRFSPSTYTAFSFGVQGGLQVRGDTADTYFADMKKLNNASNLPTIVGAIFHCRVHPHDLPRQFIVGHRPRATKLEPEKLRIVALMARVRLLSRRRPLSKTAPMNDVRALPIDSALP